MDTVFLQLLTARNLGSSRRGQEFFEILRQTNPDLLPQFYNYYEPVNVPFNPDDLDGVLEAWVRNIIFRRRGSPKLEGSAHVGKAPTHNDIWFEIAAGYFHKAGKVVTTLGFLRELCEWCQSDLAYLHFSQGQEVETGRLSKAMPGSRPYLFLTGWLLSSYLPDLYWLTIFGPPYVKLFGRERLLSAPAYRVEELSYGGVWIQLSESPLAMRDRYDELDAQRRAIKAHLDHNAFFDLMFHPKERDFAGRTPQELQAKMDAWYGVHAYNVPEFDLSELQAPLPTPEEATALEQSIKQQFGVLTYTQPEVLADGRVVRLVSFRFWPPSPEDIEEGWKRLRQMVLRDRRKYRGRQVEYVFHRLPSELVGRLEELQERHPEFRYSV